MDYISLIDINDKNDLTEVKNIMKNFKQVFHAELTEIQG